MPQQDDSTSCGIFMACAALAVLRALRDVLNPLQTTLDFRQEHMNWLRVHMVHRYCNAIPDHDHGNYIPSSHNNN